MVVMFAVLGSFEEAVPVDGLQDWSSVSSFSHLLLIMVLDCINASRSSSTDRRRASNCFMVLLYLSRDDSKLWILDCATWSWSDSCIFSLFWSLTSFWSAINRSSWSISRILDVVTVCASDSFMSGPGSHCDPLDSVLVGSITIGLLASSSWTTWYSISYIMSFSFRSIRNTFEITRFIDSNLKLGKSVLRKSMMDSNELHSHDFILEFREKGKRHAKYSFHSK